MKSGGRKGFALVALLWALVLASALAIELHGAVRADQRATANARAEARARWAARGGMARLMERLRARLAAPSVVGALAVTDSLLVPALAYRLEGVEVRATARDARARLSLNLASPGELRATFLAAGLDPVRAAEIAERIARWRAEHPAPPRAVADTTLPGFWPPPGAFGSVEELRAVPGISGSERARVAPYLTTASDGRINLNDAPVPVLAALPGMDAEGAAALARRRSAQPVLSVYEVLDALPRGTRQRVEDERAAFEERIAFAPRHAEVEVEARPAGSPVAVRLRALVLLPGGSRMLVVSTTER